MARAVLTKKSLILKYQNGEDDLGSPKFSTQRFSNVKVDAEDEKLYEVGQALGSLLVTKVNSIEKEDKFNFVEDDMLI